jgi:hypothetical protein
MLLVGVVLMKMFLESFLEVFLEAFLARFLLAVPFRVADRPKKHSKDLLRRDRNVLRVFAARKAPKQTTDRATFEARRHDNIGNTRCNSAA